MKENDINLNQVITEQSWEALLLELNDDQDSSGCAEITGGTESDSLSQNEENDTEIHAETGELIQFSRLKPLRDYYSSKTAQKQDIRRFAFIQEDIQLTDQIGPRYLRMLIEKLTLAKTEMLEKYTQTIRKKVTNKLYSSAPNDLMYVWRKNTIRPYIIQSPGFLYKCTYADKEYKIWITPDLPACFKSGEEQAILENADPTWLIKLNKLVAGYYTLLEQRKRSELTFATQILRNHVHTYYDMLKLNPYWWQILYELKTDKKYEST